MNKTNRKNRTGPSRPQQRGRSAVIEGVYNNVHFMHAVASQIGNVVQIQTKSGAIFEGIFYTVSPHFEIVLQLVHRIEVPASTNSSLSTPASSNTTSSTNSLTSAGNIDTTGPLDDYNVAVDSIFDVLIFKPCDVVFIKAKDADLDYATKDTFQTDTAISKCNGSRFDEKELEPWQFDGESNSINGDVDINLELDGNANGWDVNDMFSFNEQRYGVQSTFDQSLSGYTIQIQKDDTKDYRDAEEQAEKIALEIESQPAYKERTDIENGDENEEAKFAAVERPQSSSPDEIKVGKYVAPGRRKQHNTQAGKLIRPSQLNNSNNNTSSSSSSSVPILSPQQSSNNKYPSLVSHSLPPQPTVQKNTVQPQPPGPQQTLIHRTHNQSTLQQVQMSHKLNGDDQPGNEMKHNHHRRHRSDIDSDRNERGDRIDRGDRLDKDNRESRDPRDRENRDRDIRENIRDGNKGGPPMPQRGGMRHYSNQQMVQSGNLTTFSETISGNNSNSQLLVTPQINQMPPPSHQGPPPHQSQVRMYHNSPLMAQDNQQNMPTHVVIQQQIGPPPQPQRQRIQRDEQTSEFRKFKQNFILTSSKGQRGNEQSQSHQNQAGSELRPPHEENANQSKPFSKPYVNQLKQYAGQPVEPPISNLNPDGEKRSISGQQQQVIYLELSKTGANPNSGGTNQLTDAKVEQPTQTYVSVVQQQTQPPPQPQQQMHTQKTPVQSQPLGNVPTQSTSPPIQQQPNRDTERSTPNISDTHQEYQSPVSQTSQQQTSNASSSSSSTPPATSTPQTPGSINNESTSSEKQQNAPKKYTLNPAAKPFTPRIPVTPNSSRPHTPLTPGTQPNNAVHPNHAPAAAQPNQLPMHPTQQPTPQPPQIPGQHVTQGPVMTMAYFVQQQQSYPTPPHQQAIAYSGASMGLRKPAYDRKNQLPVSQVQVAAAASAVTGAPLHVATPMAPYISPYPQAHPQTFQGPYAHMVLNRYPENPHQPQQLQYLTATPPSTTPSPGQPHQQQFHQGPQQAGTTQYQAAPQQFQVIPVMNGPPVVTPYMQPPNSGPFLLMQPHPQQ
ncbi:ataxin-2 homolog isoform X4 [Sitodiplosis mosellana]|uniref:ataxin-2 homolog isoform X4 n=1 Tax=Sitodiplosis mosellana TaxID=263140 RepID=UPI002445130D|nr:ataxin-2 homolog isoform X4 [Sitodiplosis mosellana]